MLSDRKKKILYAVVEGYIDSAAPVSSKEIQSTCLGDCSSATIRNELSALESMGYLIQPHVSAGRIPSEKAFRLYVNRLMSDESLPIPDLTRLACLGSRRGEDPVDFLADVIAELTDYTSVVVKEDMSDTITAIRLVDLYNGKLLVVIVTDSRLMKDGTVDIPEEFTEQMIARAEEWLNKIFVGKHVSDFVNFDYPYALSAAGFESYNAVFKKIIDVLKRESLQNGMDVTVSGKNNIFRHTEYADSSKNAQRFLNDIEKKANIAELFTDDGGRVGSVTVKIGSTDHAMEGCSVVTTRVVLGNNVSGSMGVIGPMRMDYKKVLGVLEHVGQILSEIMGEHNV